MTLRDVRFPFNKKIHIFLENNPCEKGEGYHDRKDNHERDAGNYGARVAFERKLDNGRTFIHAEPPLFFRVLQVRYSGMNRGKDYARQRHDSFRTR